MLKSVNTRVKECIQIRSKMQEFNLDAFEELEVFVEAMNRHIKNGDRCMGEIFLPNIRRYFIYNLEDVEGVESTVLLRTKKE